MGVIYMNLKNKKNEGGSFFPFIFQGDEAFFPSFFINGRQFRKAQGMQVAETYWLQGEVSSMMSL